MSRLPGGVAGGPEAGGHSAPIRPLALPGRATLRPSLATLRSWGARPPYWFGLLSRAATGRGRCVVLARWCQFARLSRPPREQAVGGAGALGVRIQLRPPPGVTVPSGGGGTFPRPRGGWRAGAPVARRPGGGVGGEKRGGRATAPRPPALWDGPWPPSLSPFSSGAPPWGIHVQAGLQGGRGRRARSGRPPVGQCGGGWGGGLLATVRSPAFPRLAPEWASSFAHSWLPPFRCQSAAGNAGVTGRPTGGAWHAVALAAAVAPTPWVQRPPRGGGWPPSLWLVSGRPWAGWGGGGGEGGGEGGHPAVPPWFPDAAPRRPRGGGLVVAVPGGQPPTGVRTLPTPPSTLWVPDPRAGSRSGALLPSPSLRGASWPGGGGGDR